MKNMATFLSVLVMVAGLSVPAQGALTFTFSTIDVPNAVGTFGTRGINNSGQIAGSYNDSNNMQHGYLLSGGSFTTIDYPGTGPSSTGYFGGTWVQGINDSGVMVGGHGPTTLGIAYGFVYSGGTFSSINFSGAPGGSLSADAIGINNAGEIVGQYEAASAPSTFCTSCSFPTWPGICYSDTGGSYSAFIPPGSSGCVANGTNSTGDIVGVYTANSGAGHGFLYSGGSYTTIDFPGGSNNNLNGINDSGQVVGGYTDSGGKGHGFLYSGSTYTSFDVPNAASTVAYGINNDGKIVGDFTDTAGKSHGFLATPVAPASCTYTISPASQSIDSAGGAGNVSVTTSSDCAWTVSGTLGWLTITSSSSGTGSGTVSFSVTTNTSGASRTGNITIANNTFNVTQSGTSGNCTYSASPASSAATFGATGGSGMLTLTPSSSACNQEWYATSDSAWLTLGYTCSTGICYGINVPGGIGSGTITYKVAANTGSTNLTGNINISVLTAPFVITEQANSCISCNLTFGDVTAADSFRDYISSIACAGITQGCGNGNYCPAENVSRAQMAAFIVRAKEGEPPSDYCSAGSPFSDVASTDGFCKYIKRLSELQITTGCGNGNYCPDDYVTREQMAAFLIRALYGQSYTCTGGVAGASANCSTTTPYFGDVPSVPSDQFFPYIQKLYELGITTGCGNGEYCPSEYVTRDQMAAFLFRAFQSSLCPTTACTTAAVSVTVTDSVTGNAIKGATVTAGTQTATTDATGLASFTGLSATQNKTTPITVSVTASGYTAQTTTALLSCSTTSAAGVSLASVSAPFAQVTNNQASGTFTDAKIGNVDLPPPSGWSSYCAGGCSSAFYAVATGTNAITIAGTSYGSLGTFNNNTYYAVNIRDGGCAELWIRTNRNPTFNNDTTKTFVVDNGRCSTACTTAAVSVTVTDSVTGKAIKGATVTAGTQTATTDASGLASITGLSATHNETTPITISVAASGYTAQTTGALLECDSTSYVTAQLVPNVSIPALVSIAVTPAKPSVPVGTQYQFTATGTYSDNSTKNITSSVTWGISNTSVGTITSSGFAATTAVGTATITATLGSIQGSTTVTVTQAATSSVADGTYTYDSGTLSINTVSSTFPCEGPDNGIETHTGVTITSTTMTWPKDGMTWTRTIGPADDVVGVWSFTDSSTGNSYIATFADNGTYSLSGTIISCGGGNSGSANISTSASHWSSLNNSEAGYYVDFFYNDPNKTASSVSVTGPGISNSLALTYYTDNGGEWGYEIYSGHGASFGTSYPAGLPFTYTFTVTDTTGTWTATSLVTCFQVSFATNLSPAGKVSGTPTFSWTGIGDSSATYQVQLNDSSNTRIWNSDNTSGTSVAYSGPALTQGTTYYYFVIVQSSSSCSNGMSGTTGTFSYQ